MPGIDVRIINMRQALLSVSMESFMNDVRLVV